MLFCSFMCEKVRFPLADLSSFTVFRLHPRKCVGAYFA